MRSYRLLPLGLISFSFFLLVSASPAKAQCSANVIGFGDVGVVPQNAFHADVVFTRSGPPVPVHSSLLQRPRSVARDAQGRVRSEGVTGEYKHDTGADAGSNAEEHIIRICDPIAQTLTQIDTLNSSAKIIHSQPSAPSSTPRRRSFCESRLPLNHTSPATSVEDLGTQTIEGVEAHGVRIKHAPLNSSDRAELSMGENVTERWCSDELSAIVLTVNENTKTGFKRTIAMKNIERTEPDAALFQIPQDYAITESVAEDHVRTRPASNPEPAEAPANN
jgi:hypothetical protein